MDVKHVWLQSEAMNSKDREPQANITPFGLRMQPDLKARVSAAARTHNRSMNAEIVERLEKYETLFDAWMKADSEISALQKEVDNLRAELESEKSTREYLEEIRTLLEHRLAQAEEGDFSYFHTPDERTLYVAIDADGNVISWPEIMQHLEEITRNLKEGIDSISANVFDAKIVSSGSREEKLWELVQHYRKMRKGED